MRIKVLSLSLSFNMVSEPREKTLFFQFTRVINSGNPSSDRVSFRSPFPSPKAFQSAISWSENPHHRQHFSDNIFQHRPHHQEHKEEICNFSQSTGAKNPPTRLPRAIFLRQPKSHVPARGPLSGAELLPVGSSGTILHF